jgi:phosphoribosyl 1,2-cyclic phosphate phosphodiesterase
MRLTILGCGGAAGVPLIGGSWGDCDPLNPRNRRRRASILVEHGTRTLLVDTGPDCRAQLIDAGVQHLDAILYTHVHADHTHGIDEIRQLNRMQRQAIEAWGTRDTLDHLIRKFDYIFDAPGTFTESVAFYKPSLNACELRWGEAFDCHGIPVLPFGQDHGFSVTTGFRFGDAAYSTDLVNLDDTAFAALKGVKVWIVGCLQEAEHPTHAHLAKVLEWIDRVGPDRAVLTHLSHRLDYAQLAAKCPKGVEPAYDGMVIDVPSKTPGSKGGRVGTMGAVLAVLAMTF